MELIDSLGTRMFVPHWNQDLFWLMCDFVQEGVMEMHPLMTWKLHHFIFHATTSTPGA